MTGPIKVSLNEVQPSEAGWFSEKGLEYVLFCLLHDKPLLPVLTRKHDGRYIQVYGRHRLLGHSILKKQHIYIIAPRSPHNVYASVDTVSSEAIDDAQHTAEER